MSDVCRARGVRLLAYGTLAGGWLSDRWLGKSEPDWERGGTWSQMKYGRFMRTAGGWDVLQGVLRAADSVARRHGVSIANVASRYVLEQPAVAGVIIGARPGEREHVEDNLRVFSFTLTSRDREELESALATLAPIPGDCGDEYRRPPFLTASGDLSHHVDSFPAPYAVERRGDGRTLCLSGTPWEGLAGFSRATRRGTRVHVSGTTATHGSLAIGGTDPAAQTHFAIDKIEGALQSLGARLDDVVRTRVFVRRLEDWEAVARAHGERFARIQPANTLVAAALVGEEYLVEIEAEAEVPGP
jgi:enamine deaminase RidA (YjgF/YER057c/UK114 family)